MQSCFVVELNMRREECGENIYSIMPCHTPYFSLCYTESNPCLFKMEEFPGMQLSSSSFSCLQILPWHGLWWWWKCLTVWISFFPFPPNPKRKMKRWDSSFIPFLIFFWSNNLSYINIHSPIIKNDHFYYFGLVLWQTLSCFPAMFIYACVVIVLFVVSRNFVEEFQECPVLLNSCRVTHVPPQEPRRWTAVIMFML